MIEYTEASKGVAEFMADSGDFSAALAAARADERQRIAEMAEMWADSEDHASTGQGGTRLGFVDGADALRRLCARLRAKANAFLQRFPPGHRTARLLATLGIGCNEPVT